MTQQPLTHNSTARRMAKTILNSFRSYFADYLNATLAAKARFEKADWLGIQAANVDRLELYKTRVEQTVNLLRQVTSKDISDLDLWRAAKTSYSQLVFNFPNFEIAETFFNSVFAEIHAHDKIDDDIIYVLSSQLKSIPDAEYSIFLRYEVDEPEATFRRIFQDTEFSLPFANLDDDLHFLMQAFNRDVAPVLQNSVSELKIDILESTFYRSKAAYLVGRIVDDEDARIPMVLAILNNEQGGLFIDAALFSADEMSVVFSFTRNHFMVDAPLPYQYMHFLKQLMPNKLDYEIYNSLGFPKHAKTEFFRQLTKHLRHSDDQFVIAPGIRGKVMTVFTLPSYGIVFKVIKDEFAPPKEVTPEVVRDRYNLVTRHDRIGRMADTQEFDNLVFPLQRFSPELLEELQRVAASKIEVRENQLVIRHLYTERYMTPLNIYVTTVEGAQLRELMEEYGNCIKQLAAANIFPGDMPLKNFGVTRHGRVVFYDYDEIVNLTECNFRTLPKPATEEQEIHSGAWYSVGANDVFPEEFRLFFSGNPEARKLFEEMHSDLYQVEFWQSLQEKIRNGYVVDVFPYRRARRFERDNREEYVTV